MRLIITGGAGFIGSALIRFLLDKKHYDVLNIDKLTYSANPMAIEQFNKLPNYHFESLDICESDSISKVFNEFKPEGLIHLAAETHVDRSIDNPSEFIKTNIFGTYNLLEISRKYIKDNNQIDCSNFRFHHVSTDEVYGSLDGEELFHEETAYKPNSPYSSSKASADHLVRSWNKTYKLPTVITNCSNNYGPYQFPEKLIPLMILNALEEKNLPIYGDGTQVRDWLYVDDHVDALMNVFHHGTVGETYNIGSRTEMKNVDLVKLICRILNKLKPHPSINYEDLITYVKDRPGHDKRYAINPEKVEKELNWSAKETIESGLEKTIMWYMDNFDWCRTIHQRQRLGNSVNS